MRKKISIQILFILILFLPSLVYADWKVSEIKTKNKPTARFGASIAYDASRECVVLFGGDQGSRQTWEFDDKNWKAVQSTYNPPARLGGAMAFFPEIGKAVLFGGVKMPGTHPDYIMLNDTWVYSATGWSTINCTENPSPRSEASLVYDKKRKCLVLFGGMSSKVKSKATLNDTWEFDGKTWKQIEPKISPNPQSSQAMAYDYKRGVVVMYGGNSGDVQTWEYNGETWENKFIFPSPGSRTGHTLVYDPENEIVVLIGGVAPSSVKQKDAVEWKENMLWFFTDKKWKVTKLNHAVPGYISAAVVYNPKRKSIMGFGGLSFSQKGDPRQSNLTWEITNTSD